MKYLYALQSLLVLLCSFMALPLATCQISEPLPVYLKNSGSTFIDQFAGNQDFTFYDFAPSNPSIGNGDILLGSETNTLKVIFTPSVGAVGSTDFTVTYYSISTPFRPITRSYRFFVANELIIAQPDRYLIDSGAVDFPLEVLGNDSSSSSALTISSIAVSNSGTATINATGDAILFTPDAEFTGDTWIQYIACDTAGNCGEGKVHVLVRDPNAQQTHFFKKYLLNREQLEIITPFTGYLAGISPSHGTLDSINPITWVYTPDEGYVGKDTFELSLQGIVPRNYEVTVYGKPVNSHARDDKFYVRPGLSVSFNVMNNDLLDVFNFKSNTNTSKGVLSNQGNGQFVYSPNQGYRGVDKFTYTVCFQDTVYCETATVYIHVTDLEPDNVFTYKLQTSADLPLTIDYPIAFTDFSYIIANEPEHGTFTFHEGVQEISLPCETIEAYNMLVYTPNAGYTGPDHFAYYYCVVPSNICTLVRVDVEVVPVPESENCPCIVNCAWPGDSDLDGRVDMNDLLRLGYGLGSVGPVRDYNDPSAWFGQYGSSWPASGNGFELQYLDGNGDGSITADDVALIDQNYNRSHDVVARDVQQKLPYQFSIIPVQFSLDSGDLVILDIAFGNANGPVLDMKGGKYSVNIPPYMLDSASVAITFHQDSWLADGSPNISLGKVPWDGRVDAGFAKANGNGSSGYGVISTIVFIVEDDIEGFKNDDGIIEIPVTLESCFALGPDGTIYEVEGDKIFLTYDTGKPNANPYNLILYPNPAQDLVNVHLNGKTSIESINIIDPQGRIVKSYDNIDAKQHQVDVSAMPVGLYFVQVMHEHGMMTKTLSVIR